MFIFRPFTNTMKTMKYYSINFALALFFIFFQGVQNNLYGQITSIPDINFEQALIDLAIDSDGVINGQVLTSDINQIIALDISNKGTQDLTGIDDFTALEILDVSNNSLSILDVSDNLQLKELYVSNTGGENLVINSLDLSNNLNLELLHGENLFILEELNLQNGNNSILNVTLSCEHEGIPCELTELDCVTVDNAEAATNNDSPYSTWHIEADFFYSGDCSLGVIDNNLAAMNVYPNPVENVLFIDDNEHIKIEKITIFDMLGKVVLIDKDIFNQLNLSEIKSGVLFIKIETENETITKRILKK